MRIDDGERALDEAGLHLTTDEARALVVELTRLVEQADEPGSARGGVGELDLRLYPTTELRDVGFAGSLDPIVWVGLVEIEAIPGSELREHGDGAFATACVLAVTADEYRARVTGHLSGEGMEVVGFTDVCPLTARPELSEKTRELAREATETGEVACDTFYVFQAEGGEGEELETLPIAVTDAEDVEEAVTEVAAWSRGWLTGALDHYPGGFVVEAVSVAFAVREDEGPPEHGYVSSADDPAGQAELFRAVLEMVEAEE